MSEPATIARMLGRIIISKPVADNVRLICIVLHAP
jgi:hypothetical protein